MKSGETAPIPYMRALFTSTHLGSLLVASELLTGQCLAFVALALAGAAFQLLLPLLSKLCFRGPGPVSYTHLVAQEGSGYLVTSVTHNPIKTPLRWN